MKPINVRKLECHLDQNVMVYYQDGEPYTGTVYEMFGSRVDIIYQVFEGSKHGFELELYPHLRIQSIKHYSNNLLDGTVTRFYESGAKEETAYFERGVCIESYSYEENSNAISTMYTIDSNSIEYEWLTYLQQEFSFSYV